MLFNTATVDHWTVYGQYTTQKFNKGYHQREGELAVIVFSSPCEAKGPVLSLIGLNDTAWLP
ncbi:hypothetical protein C8Q78DRAFT_1080587 [Trametes maxima]|nr:hypothetical protein C8Q78DRAFT_1080587 [Trametes maxima]